MFCRDGVFEGVGGILVGILGCFADGRGGRLNGREGRSVQTAEGGTWKDAGFCFGLGIDGRGVGSDVVAACCSGCPTEGAPVINIFGGENKACRLQIRGDLKRDHFLAASRHLCCQSAYCPEVAVFRVP